VQLVNEFRVPVPIGQAWDVLTDVERVAPCIPGAELLGVDGDDFTGAVKVKVGPITVQYKGNGTFLEKDEAAHRAVIKGTAKETRGQGNASAIITAELKDEGDATACVLTTDLTISGKAAQFGRGVLADVSSNLIGQFADRLEADLLAGARGVPSENAGQRIVSTPTGAGEAVQTPKSSGPDDAASVDVFKLIAGPLAKRALPVAAGVVAGIGLGLLLGRGRRQPYVIVLPAQH
jgi:uncharacterized protein